MPQDSTKWRVSYSYLKHNIPEEFIGTLGEVYEEVCNLARYYRQRDSKVRTYGLSAMAHDDILRIYFRNPRGRRRLLMSLHAE